MSLTWLVTSFVAMMAVVGLASDAGRLWIARAALQNSVDSAAMAGALELPNGTEAEEFACGILEDNSVLGILGADQPVEPCGIAADFSLLTNDSGIIDGITVTAYSNVSPIFGRLALFDVTKVGATATARIGSVGSACLFPIFLTEAVINEAIQNNPPEDPYRPYPVIVSDTTANSQDPVRGGVFTDSRISQFKTLDNVTSLMVDHDDCKKSVNWDINTPIDVGTGDFQKYRDQAGKTGLDGWDAISKTSTGCPSSNPFASGNAYLTYDSQAKRWELKPNINIGNCPRLVIMAIMPDATRGEINGFAAFYLGGVCREKGNQTCSVDAPAALGGTVRLVLEPADFWGYFVPLEVTSTDYTTYNERYGTKMVYLES